MSLWQRQGFEHLVLSNPQTMVSRQWGDCSVAKIGGKVYCLLSGAPREIWLKVSDMAFDLMPEMPFIRPAPYFARAHWVAIAPQSPLSEAEIAAYIAEAYRLVAARLTRRARQELGLGDKV